MSDKFLQTGGGANADISNGTVKIFGATLAADNLEPSKAIKTNSVKQLISTNLEISDINNLQNQLNNTIINPYNGVLKAIDFETNNITSIETEINDKISKTDTSIQSIASDININGTLNVNSATTNQTSFTADQELVSKKFVADSIASIPVVDLTTLNQKTTKLTTTGDITGSILTDITSFTADQELVSKKFVDDSIASIPAVDLTTLNAKTANIIEAETDTTKTTFQEELYINRTVPTLNFNHIITTSATNVSGNISDIFNGDTTTGLTVSGAADTDQTIYINIGALKAMGYTTGTIKLWGLYPQRATNSNGQSTSTENFAPDGTLTIGRPLDTMISLRTYDYVTTLYQSAALYAISINGVLLVNTSIEQNLKMATESYVNESLTTLNEKTTKLTNTGDITGSILTDITSFTADQELVSKKFVDDSLIPLNQKTTKLTNTGDITGSILTNQTSFTADQELVSKKFVDDSLITLNQKTQYQSATGTTTDFSSFVRYNGFVYDAPTALNHLTPKVYVDTEIGKIPVYDQSLNTTDGVKFSYVDTPILYNNNASGTVYIGGDRVRLGEDAGASNQTTKAVAVGFESGYANQGLESVAIGNQAGKTNQTTLATAVGTYAGWNNQGLSSVAIGNEAGSDGQGSYCVAIGAYAGQLNQPNNSIIINANGGTVLNPTTSGFFVKPIALSGAKENMCYDPNTGQITFNAKAFLTIYDDNIVNQTRSLGQGYLHKKFGDGKLYWLSDISASEVDLTHQALYDRVSALESLIRNNNGVTEVRAPVDFTTF